MGSGIKVLRTLVNPPKNCVGCSFLRQKSFFLMHLACPKRIIEVRALTIPGITFSEDFGSYIFTKSLRKIKPLAFLQEIS